LYSRTSSPYQDENYYKLETSGGSIRFGVPFTEIDTVFFGLGIEKTTIVPGTDLPVSYENYAKEYGYSSTALPLTVGWARDSRDSALAPTSGRLQRANAEWSFAGDAKYLRATYQFQQYVPLNKQFTAAFNTEVGLGRSIGGGSFPVFKNFYGGGLGSVRGFEQGSLGPNEQADGLGTSLGGSRKLNVNMEILAPFPGAGNDRTLRMYGFWDVGMVGGDNASNANANDLRSSVGVGISWISPVGPLRLAFAKPIRKFDNDRIQSLQFQIGTSF
jgi:outer membrane protein insertion porin family